MCPHVCTFTYKHKYLKHTHRYREDVSLGDYLLQPSFFPLAGDLHGEVKRIAPLSLDLTEKYLLLLAFTSAPSINPHNVWVMGDALSLGFP